MLASSGSLKKNWQRRKSNSTLLVGVLPKKESPTKELCFSCVTPPLEFLASNSRKLDESKGTHFSVEEAIKSYADVVLNHLK